MRYLLSYGTRKIYALWYLDSTVVVAALTSVTEGTSTFVGWAGAAAGIRGDCKSKLFRVCPACVSRVGAMPERRPLHR